MRSKLLYFKTEKFMEELSAYLNMHSGIVTAMCPVGAKQMGFTSGIYLTYSHD
jgi:hypothetical protein